MVEAAGEDLVHELLQFLEGILVHETALDIILSTVGFCLRTLLSLILLGFLSDNSQAPQGAERGHS